MSCHNPNQTMNTENNSGNNTENSESPPHNAAEKTDTKRHYDSCSNAFRAGRDDATAKAREAAPKFKGVVADTIYDVAYGVTYGAFFAGAFANEFIPKAVKDVLAQGVEKGAAAGRAAADKVRQPSGNEVGKNDPQVHSAPA